MFLKMDARVSSNPGEGDDSDSSAILDDGSDTINEDMGAIEASDESTPTLNKTDALSLGT